MKLWLVTGALIASGVLLAGVGILAVPSVDDAIFTHFVTHQLRTGNDALLKGDDLRVLLCGTSAPFADPHGAQSCTAIIAGGHYFLIDTGPGSGRNLEFWQHSESRRRAPRHYAEGAQTCRPSASAWASCAREY